MGIFDQLHSKKFLPLWFSHRNIYIVGLCMLLGGVAWSNFLMSLGQFFLLINWLLELDFRKKWSVLKENKSLQILLCLFILHLVSFLWSDDIKYAIHDTTKKIPLLILPLVIGTTKVLERKEWQFLSKLYLFVLLILSLVSLSKYLGVFGEINDKRELSILISHIRYGLNICLGVFIAFFIAKSSNAKHRFLYLALAIWFVCCLVLFELFTALVCFILCSLFYSIYFYIFKNKNRLIKAVYSVGVILLFGLSYNSISSIHKDFYRQTDRSYNEKLNPPLTENGNKYHHDNISKIRENGSLVWKYVCYEEIKTEWNKRSNVDYYKTDKKGQLLEMTLIRFITSKGLKKDSVGINQLSDEEINAVENGISNTYYLTHNSIQVRIHKIIYEIDNYLKLGIANGFSIAMRLEYWKNSWKVTKQNFWAGTGVGDVKEAIKRQYEKDASTLEEKYRKRTHNQYLAIFLGFGIFGLLYFLFYLAFPFYALKSNRLIYSIFLIIACLSFIGEDTLESQAGVTFFALFNSLLLFALPKSAYK